MTSGYSGLRNAMAVGIVFLCAAAAPAFAASQDEDSGSTASQQGDTSELPATKAQTEQLEGVSKDREDAPTREKGMEAGGMPATAAQKEQLDETDTMTTDEASTPATD